jgi:hypothetical protein
MCKALCLIPQHKRKGREGRKEGGKEREGKEKKGDRYREREGGKVGGRKKGRKEDRLGYLMQYRFILSQFS